MNISLNWLKRYLVLDLPVSEISEILTTIGLEVEGVKEVEAIQGGLRGLKIGKVLTKAQHPNADKLSVTTVDVGTGEPLNIVCGAPNVDAGQKVVVATIGTTLYNAEEPWKIKKGKIRGEISEGMICAEDEIGLGKGHDGIMVLPDDATVGMDAADYFGIETDIVFDIGLTPNRSDATSHLGVARDLYAYLAVNKGYEDDIKEPDLSKFDVKHESLLIKVEVEDHEACPRYSGVTLSNVNVGESPEWIKKFLSTIGVRPINNVVDITNYVLHEYGQPLHAFDADKIGEGKIIVKKLADGAAFTTLDEVDRKLSSEDLMICDGNSDGMCIAGVFGGVKSGVKDETKNIFLESAHFDANTIRKTSTRHLLRTDAAKIYEKGSDPNITTAALKRAANLMVEYAGATIASNIVDIYPEEIKPRSINIRYQNVNSHIGADISKEEIHNILRAMDMELKLIDEDTLKVLVPTNKADVIREVDVIEEILRIYGFNKIALPSKITSTLHFKEFPNKRYVKEALANHLSNNGYNEMMGMSLIESNYFKELLPLEDDKLVYINNTSNIHLDIMRPEMMVSGLLSVAHNLNRQQNDLKLYEYGKAYLKSGDDYEEAEYLTLFISGNKAEESWLIDGSNEVSFYDIKKCVHSVLQKASIKGYQEEELSDSNKWQYGMRYFRGNKTIATYGEVKSGILQGLGIKSKVYYAELPIDILVSSAQSAKNTVTEISKFPGTRRDLALVLDKHVKFDTVKSIAFKTDKKILKEVNLFDVYDNEEVLGEGKKSYAVSYNFEDKTKTLKDKEVDKIMNKLIGSYEEKLAAQIRR